MEKAVSDRAYKDVCEETLLQFFSLLERRIWENAEGFVKQVEEMDLDGEWRRGYVNALRGMILSLTENTSPIEPYILEVRKYDGNKLQEAKLRFKEGLQRGIRTRFDEGYFQAWYQYVRYLLSKTNAEKKGKGQKNLKQR